MRRFPLTRAFSADCQAGDGFLTGQIYHVKRNLIGRGSVSTPVPRYFAHCPGYVEGVNPHWRIDCFAKPHPLAGTPEDMTRALCTALLDLGYCTTPLWMSWHRAEEIGGTARGALWEDG